jgi:3-dehydroquinate dehydratase-1
MSAAEINNALSLLGQLPKKSIYGIHSITSSRIATPQAPFYEKCFNELGLPHHFAVVERQPNNPGCMEAWCNQKTFGGAYITPPLSHSSLTRHSSFFASLSGGSGPILSEAAKAIGMVDTIVVKGNPPSRTTSAPTSIPSSPRPHHADPFNHFHPTSGGGLPTDAQLVLDNATWRGVLCTLTKDLAPSAYYGRSAIVIANSVDDAASAVFALKALKVGKIYTGGFRTPESLTRDGLLIEPFQSLEGLERARMVGDEGGAPFLIVSALGPDKGNLVGLLLKMFGTAPREGNGAACNTTKKVFLDLAGGGRGSRSEMDPAAVASQMGWTAYGAADVAAFTTVETLRRLVGQNVPYSFVRLASGRGMY